MANVKVRPACSVPGCDRPNCARGVCNTHYKRLRKGQDLEPPIAVNSYYTDELCMVEGCDERRRRRGWCHNHYQTWYRYRRDPSEDHRRPCSVCVHPSRNAIEISISSGMTMTEAVAGTGLSERRVEHHLTHTEVLRPGWDIRRGLNLCRVCAHPDVELIDDLWSRRPRDKRRVHGELSGPNLAKRFGVESSALYSHNSPNHQQRLALYQLARLNALKETA